MRGADCRPRPAHRRDATSARPTGVRTPAPTTSGSAKTSGPGKKARGGVQQLGPRGLVHWGCTGVKTASPSPSPHCSWSNLTDASGGRVVSFRDFEWGAHMEM